MGKNVRWSRDKYRIAMQGDTMPGLRSVVKGFEASDGYDLRRIDEWSPSQKRRVREYYKRMHGLLAQEKIVVRPRNKGNLDALQDAFHGDVPSKQFKVAFVPYTTPKGLPGAKKGAPKIRYLESGVSVDAGAYERLFVPFNKRALVKDTQKEIRRVIDSMPGARLFFVQTGEFQTLNGESARSLTEKVIRYMSLYDGVKQLPRSSGNSGDDPRYHHWKQWLNGVVGFIFSKRLDVSRIQKQIIQGMQAAKERRKQQDKAMKRKGKR